tara:strand:- start:42 stop:377 length:336 start_codon:yes stop_codon:yes gene_type:complete
MEILERTENDLLNRVELKFRWDHPKLPTPSLKDMVQAITKAEPGSKKELVFVKDVSTRFGMTRTSGIAMIYESAEASTIEPKYVLERHKFEDENEESESNSGDSEAQEGDE